MGEILKAEQLRKSYGSHVALKGLDLTVSEGEVLCLLGANGAGKSTTIGLFLGLLQPDSGRCLVSGINPALDRFQATQHLAYIPEQVALYPQLSGLENLHHFVRLSGQDRNQDELMQLLVTSGLTEAQALRRANGYSKGMRQKVGIAIAVAKNADALLLDEPMSGLDPSAANEFCQLLNDIKSSGKAVLMATHDIFRAKLVGTRVGIMHAGELVEQIETTDVDANHIEEIYLSHMAGEVA